MKSDSLRKFGSLKKFAKKSDQGSNGSTSLDRKWFFNKPSSAGKNSLPVPTAQFRSYRRIRGNEGSAKTGNFTSHVGFFHSGGVASLQQVGQNVSVPNLTVTESMGEERDEKKSKPVNYVHASNPSLCNLSDFNLASSGSFKKSGFKNESFAGFVTLEELMKKECEERRLNPFNLDEEEADLAINLNLIKPDVVYGKSIIK